MEIDELRDELLNYTNDEWDPYTFFCHLTERDNGDSINENGILLDNNKLTSTAIELEKSFYDNPVNFIQNEVGNPQTRRKEIMVLIGCPTSDIKNLVQKNYDSEDDEYVIPCENILGNIDLESLYFSPNPNSELGIGFESTL